MRLVTWNVNGIRAAGRNGFLQWLQREDADVVCLQEIKATPAQLEPGMVHPPGYESFWHPAEKAGYSGVAVYSRTEPLSVSHGIGVPAIDREGRVLILEFKRFTLLNAYFPNSQHDGARLDYKLAFCDQILKTCNRLRKAGKNVLLCGDFNIAHREIDLRNPKANVNNAGFLPEERAWMDRFVEAGYVDGFRNFESGPEHYTWWSYRPGVRDRNIGWRLDYQCVNAEFKDALRSVIHRPEVRGSDHCPVIAELRE